MRHEDTICPVCARRTNPRPSQATETILHWIVFLAMMIVIFAAGYALTP
jgi:hypothetical protein